MDYTVHGILQARILKCVAFPFSRGSSQSRDHGSLSLLQGIFLTQESNWGLLHCKGILYQLSYLLLQLLSRFSRVQHHRRQPTRLPRPWDSPGKNTGVGCHCLLQCMKVKSESEVAQSCPTLSNPMDCSPPGSSVHGISQAKVLELGAIAFSELSYQRSPI